MYATIGTGIVNTAFTVVSVSPCPSLTATSQQPGSSLELLGLMTEWQHLLRARCVSRAPYVLCHFILNSSSSLLISNS